MHETHKNIDLIKTAAISFDCRFTTLDLWHKVRAEVKDSSTVYRALSQLQEFRKVGTEGAVTVWERIK